MITSGAAISIEILLEVALAHLLSIVREALILVSHGTTASSVATTSTAVVREAWVIATSVWLFFELGVTVSKVAFFAHNTVPIVFVVSALLSLVLGVVDLGVLLVAIIISLGGGHALIHGLLIIDGHILRLLLLGLLLLRR